MASGQSYPSPSAAQMGAGAGLYVNAQNGGSPQQTHQMPEHQMPEHQIPEEDLQIQAIQDQLTQSAPQMHISTGPAGDDNSAHQLQQAFQHAQQQQQSYQHTPSQQPFQHNSPQQMPIAQMDIHGPYSPPSDGEGNQRKRSKVSRACDQCRRKKVKCDSGGENGPEACSNCKRSGLPCEFSRQPMKRGPSKGYIKELADKVQALESRVQILEYELYQLRGPPQDLQSVSNALVDGASQTQNIVQYPTSIAGRKRTFSMSEDFHNSPPEYRTAPAMDYQQATGAGPTEWNSHVEVLADEYYKHIHPAFPVLPHDKDRLRQTVSDCPQLLRQIFFSSLENAIRSSPFSSLEPTQDHAERVRQVGNFIRQAHQGNEIMTSSFGTSIVLVQVSVLHVLEAESRRRSSTEKNPTARSYFLTLAYDLASRNGIFAIPSERITPSDMDSDEKTARRIMWSLLVLDRFDSVASGTRPVINEAAVFHALDRTVLGEIPYQIARAAVCIGDVASVLSIGQSPQPENPSDGIPQPAPNSYSQHWAQETLSRFREGVDLGPQSPFTQLLYHHLELCIHRSNPAATAEQLISVINHSSFQVSRPECPTTPLNHHFTALAVLTLLDLPSMHGIPDQISHQLRIFQQVAGQPNNPITGVGKSDTWGSAIRELVDKRVRLAEDSNAATTRMLGLQHLANAAIGEQEGAERSNDSLQDVISTEHDNPVQAAAQEAAAAAQQHMVEQANGHTTTSLDPTQLLRQGYLKELARLSPRAA